MARYLPQQYCRRSRRRPYIGIVGFYVEIVFFVAVGIIRGVKYWSMYKDITHFCIDRNANSRYSPGSFPYNLSHKKYELFIELSSLLISKSSQSYVGIVCIYIVTRFTYLLYHIPVIFAEQPYVHCMFPPFLQSNLYVHCMFPPLLLRDHLSS